MSNTPYFYSDIQFEEVENFLEENVGSHYDYVVHEVESEYVHTDVFIVKSAAGEKQFVTCGMGARKMQSVADERRCELLLATSNRVVITGEKGFVLSSELVKVSKYPFREDTWIGAGHTINTSKNFQEKFGYEYFAFAKTPLSLKLSGLDEKVDILRIIPIYEEEREWCINNHTVAFLEKLHEKYEGKEQCADFKREALIPDDLDEDEIFDYNLMTILDIDRPTYNKLSEYLCQQEKDGVEVTYEMIGKWVAENK